MTIINNIDGAVFEINGAKYLKNFISVINGDRVKIVNVYDSRLELQCFKHFSEFTVNGNTFASAFDLQTALLPILFTRSSLNGIIIESDIINVTYTRPILTFILSDDTTVNIDLDFVQSVTGQGVDNSDPLNPVININPPVHITRDTFAELVTDMTQGSLIKDFFYRSLADGLFQFRGLSDPPNPADLIPVGGGGDEEMQGANQVYVEAKGTAVENAAELQAAYTTAQGMSPTVNNRVTIICAAGYYSFAADFVMNTQYIDLVSIDGNRSIIFNGAGTISITANDVFVKGVNVTTKNFTIATDLNLLKLENCQGGTSSFGGGGGTASGTFNNCEGGNDSFGSGGTASGTFIDCISGFSSFGAGGAASGTFTNCQGGITSFGSGGTASGTFTNCKGGNNSFGSGGTASGTFTNCTINSVILVQFYVSNEINYRNFPASQFGTSSDPRTGNLTQNLTSAARGQVQKIYHDDSVEPTYPATWRKAGEGEYLTDASVDSKLNVIYVEFDTAGRQVYWIVQELL